MTETPAGADRDRARGEALAAIVRGMTVALLGSVVGGGLGFVFLLVMGRTLSRADFGLFVVALNLLNAVSTMSIAGADFAAIRYVAAAPDAGRKRGAMLTPIALVLALNVTLAAVIFAFARPIAVHLLDRRTLVEPLRVLAAVLPLTVLAQMLSAATSGLELARGELVRKVVEQGGRVIAGPVALALGLGLAGAIGGMAVAAAAAAAAVGAILLRTVPRGGETRPLSPRHVIGFAWPQTIANGALQLSNLIFSIVLLRLAGNTAVAAYGAAVAIARLPALVYNSFTYRFSPTIARLWDERRIDELHDLLKGVTRWIGMFAVPLYAIAITLPGPLLHVFGRSYAHGRGPEALAIVAIAVMIDSLAGPVDRALIMTGRVRLEMAANVVNAAAMVGVSILLIDLFGLLGAAVALVAFNTSVNVIKGVLVWRTLRVVPISLSLAGPLAAAAAAGAATAAIDHLTGLGSSLPGTALLALVLLVLYAAVLFRAIGISNDDRTALRLALRPARG